MAKEPTRTMSLRLPVSLAERLKLAAIHRGKTLNEFAVDVLSRHASFADEESRADVGLADFIGCLPGPRTDSMRVNEVVRAYLAEKKANGTL